MKIPNIKFRAWHEKSKRLFIVDNLDFIEGSCSVLENGKLDIYTWAIEEDPYFVILSRTTNHSDKHQKEIFEGDFLEDDDGYIYKVCFDEIWMPSFYMKKYNNQGMFIDDINLISEIYWMKIIGNCFQNPELILDLSIQNFNSDDKIKNAKIIDNMMLFDYLDIMKHPRKK